MKKLVYFLITTMFLLLLLTNNVFATENITSNKKVVSLVFDDSGSMQGIKAKNANYALQALISMLGKEDELNIVRMSNPTYDNVLKINEKITKQKSIDEIRRWESKGNTPFQAIETAKEWLNTRKTTLSDNAEYWFIIISDGQFGEGLDMKAYMNSINQNYEGLNFNAMLVSIGKDIMPSYIEAFRNSPNCYSQEIESVNQIIPTMFEISSQINSGVNIQAINAKKVDNNKIAIDLSLPINKMNIFIQKNGLKINSIEKSNNEEINFDTYDIATDTMTAQMNEVMTSKGYLENGKYIITFNEEVDLNATQIKIFVRAAVTNELRLYKRTENKDVELDDIDFFTLKENDEVIAKSKLISLVDGKKIELENLKDVNGYYYINDKKVFGKIENGELVTKIPLEPGKNTIYSLIESEGYINEKSNTRVINLINLQEVLIQYNNSKNYIKSAEIKLEETTNVTEITLNNLPKGVVVEYEEIDYSNGDRILLNGSNKILNVKSNKNYRDTSLEIVEIVANENGAFNQTESNKSYFRIGPKNAKYEIVKVNKNQNNIDMEDKILKLFVEYESFEETEKLNVENIKNIKIDNVSNGYSIKAKLNKETNEIDLTVKPTILSIFSDRKVMFEIDAEIKDSLGNAFGQFEFGITSFNLLDVLLPILVISLIVIILLGYLLKNRFNKNGYFVISSESQPYSLKEYTQGTRKYLPFVADIAQLPNIKVKAKKGNKIQIISGIEDVIEVNGEKDIQKEIILNMNNGEMMLNIDGKNIKYEYVALTADEIIENSEENNNSNENWF